jgi:hypothetical protein
MRTSLKRLATGRGTLALLLGGLLILLLAFRRKTSSSAANQIKSILKSSGYSDRVATWWVAVSNLETGAWTSKLYKEAHNLFGMKQPLTRFTYSQGATSSPPGYASFASDADSVKDLVAYMQQRLYPYDFDSIDAMVAFMKSKGYFEDPLYLEKVKGRL